MKGNLRAARGNFQHVREGGWSGFYSPSSDFGWDGTCRGEQERRCRRSVYRLSCPTLMITPDPVLLRQIPVIQKIVADETWLEGERRGCFVPSTDCVVRERVCAVVLRIGQQMRESVAAEMAPASTTAGPPTEPRPVAVTHANVVPRGTEMPRDNACG